MFNKEHITIDDRHKCALNFINKLNYKIPVYLDTMDNDFQTTFKSWPFRAIIVKNNKLCYSSIPKNSEYDILELYEFFNNIYI